jgi:hypothetical protein
MGKTSRYFDFDAAKKGKGKERSRGLGCCTTHNKEFGPAGAVAPWLVSTGEQSVTHACSTGLGT